MRRISWLVRFLIVVMSWAMGSPAWAETKSCAADGSPIKDDLAKCLHGENDPPCQTLASTDLNTIKSLGLYESAELVNEIRECSRSCQATERVCSARSAPDLPDGALSDPAKESLESLYSARDVRERLDRVLIQARNQLRIASAQCRYYKVVPSTIDSQAAPTFFMPPPLYPMLAVTYPTCTYPSSLDIDDLLGRTNTIEAASRLAAVEQVKAVGAGQVPAAVTELLSLTTEIAIEKAKRNGLELLESRIQATVCGIKVKRSIPEPGFERVFPSTCRLLENISLEELASDPRRLQPALIGDLLELGLRYLEVRISKVLDEDTTSAKEQLQRVATVLELAVKATIRIHGQQQSRPAHIDAQAIVGELLRLRCEDPGSCQVAWSAKQAAVPLAIEAIIEYVAREGRVDIATIVAELSDPPPGIAPPPGLDTNAIRADAVQLALLGLHALGLAREPTPGDEQDTWHAAVSLAFEIAATATNGSSVRKRDLQSIRELVDAVADENIPAAISAGADLIKSFYGDCTQPGTPSRSETHDEMKELLTAYLQLAQTDPTIEERTKRRLNRVGYAARRSLPSHDDYKCQQSRRLEKATHLLSGVASYAATYASATQAGKTDAELRASRKDALEGMIDATTRRSHRHGETIFSLGIPVGFSTGAQLFRRSGFQPAGGDVAPCTIDPTTTTKLRVSTRSKLCDPLAMPPQIAVPLGFGLQRLVGKRYAMGRARPADEAAMDRDRNPAERFRWDGIHSYVSLLDLGQFLAYDQKGKISEPRWSSLFSPGFQLGWAIGTPANTFIVAGEVRYAPTLFQSTTNVEYSGGALRFGVTLAYYVSLFDFN